MIGHVEPGLTPDEALRRADAWARAAAGAVGHERARAEHAAAYWAAQHRALLAAAPSYGTPPSYGTAPSYGAPPPGTSAYSATPHTAPPHAAAPHTSAPYGAAPVATASYGGPSAATDVTPRDALSPAWQPAPLASSYGTLPYEPPRRRRGRAGRLAMIAVVLVVSVGVSVVTNVREQAVQDGSVLPTAHEGAVPPPTVRDDPSPDAAPSPSGLEAAWKAGEHAEPLPDPVPGTAPETPFLPAYPDPAEWLLALNPENEGVRVVVTDDPGLNCGMAHVAEHDAWDTGAAGCFQPAHPTVLFVWWGDDADARTKQLVLAHELSHMLQWWHEFDLLQSAVDSGLAEDEEWQHAVETDATCRVLSWGGYSETAADRTSSPCDTDDWSPAWLAERAAALGVVVRDY